MGNSCGQRGTLRALGPNIFPSPQSFLVIRTSLSILTVSNNCLPFFLLLILIRKFQFVTKFSHLKRFLQWFRRCNFWNILSLGKTVYLYKYRTWSPLLMQDPYTLMNGVGCLWIFHRLCRAKHLLAKNERFPIMHVLYLYFVLAKRH